MPPMIPIITPETRRQRRETIAIVPIAIMLSGFIKIPASVRLKLFTRFLFSLYILEQVFPIQRIRQTPVCGACAIICIRPDIKAAKMITIHGFILIAIDTIAIRQFIV